jgi:hypothetical protein
VRRGPVSMSGLSRSGVIRTRAAAHLTLPSCSQARPLWHRLTPLWSEACYRRSAQRSRSLLIAKPFSIHLQTDDVDQ